MTWSEMKRNPQSWLLDFSKKPKWSYVMGIELEGMLDTYLRYHNDSILKYVESYPQKMISDKGEVTGYKYEDFNLDNIRTAKFICRMQQIAPREGNVKAMKTFFKQLQKQPRTEDGVYWHKAIYAHQVWLDGIFMGLPFYCQYASQYLKPKKAGRFTTMLSIRSSQLTSAPMMLRLDCGNTRGMRPIRSSGQTRRQGRVSIPGLAPSDGMSWQ